MAPKLNNRDIFLLKINANSIFIIKRTTHSYRTYTRTIGGKTVIRQQQKHTNASNNNISTNGYHEVFAGLFAVVKFYIFKKREKNERNENESSLKYMSLLIDAFLR